MDGSIGSFPVSPVNFSNEVGNTADIAENTLQPSHMESSGKGHLHGAETVSPDVGISAQTLSEERTTGHDLASPFAH